MSNCSNPYKKLNEQENIHIETNKLTSTHVYGKCACISLNILAHLHIYMNIDKQEDTRTCKKKDLWKEMCMH